MCRAVRVSERMNVREKSTISRMGGTREASRVARRHHVLSRLGLPIADFVQTARSFRLSQHKLKGLLHR